MLRIYNIHQIVTDKDPSRITHRNCIDYQLFDKFLSECSFSFDKLKDAIRLRSGISITIDDSTTGAYDAAMLCAAHKQHVTLFVNPYYVETGRQYHMHYLSQFVEDLMQENFCFNGHSYDLSKPKQQKRLRKAIKEVLCTLATEDERISYLEHLFNRQTTNVRLPYQLRTMTQGQLQTLIANKYVTIEYHGWTHACPTSLSVDQHIQELRNGQEWFRSNLHQDIRFFALPFGKRDCRLEDLPGFPIILLEDNSLDQNFAKHRIINRKPLEPLLEQWLSEHNSNSGHIPVYSQDGSILVRYPSSAIDEEFTVPNTVSIIGSGAFDHCKMLQRVIIPPSVHTIKRNAFAHTGIESISLPDSVEEIGDLCFYSCKNLKNIRLSESLLDIGDAVFSGCHSLETITLPKSLQKVGDGLFMGCTSLRTVFLPEHLQNLKNSTFIDCQKTPNIEIYV